MNFFQQKGKKDKAGVNPALFSPGGPSAVRKSNFKPIGTAKIHLKTALKYDQFKLSNMPWDSIIQSVIATKVNNVFCNPYTYEIFRSSQRLLAAWNTNHL